MPVVFNPFTGNLDLIDNTAAAGSDTQVQFNDGGVLGGDGGLVFNKTTNALTGGSFIPTSSTVPTNGVYSPGANQLAISTNGTGRLFVDASGNVGVGTSTPLTRLDVRGSDTILSAIRLGRNANAYQLRANVTEVADFGFFIEDGSSNDLYQVRGGASGYHRFAINNSEVARITSDGKLGLGTSSPTQLLDLESETGARIAFTDTGTRRWSIGTPEGGSASFSIYDESGDAEALRITSAGNVGIGGIQTPDELLHLSGGNIKLSMSLGTRQALIFNLKSQTITGEGNTNDLLYRTYSNHIWKTGTGSGSITDGLERVRIDSSGRLLIGTSSVPTTGVYVQRSKLVSYGSTFGDAAPGIIALVRSAAPSSVSGQAIGVIVFAANSGEEYATITAISDSPSGTGDYPGRLVFSVTADGASSPTEAMRIKNSRIINFSNAPTYADNAAALAGGLVAGDVYRKSDGTLMITY